MSVCVRVCECVCRFPGKMTCDRIKGSSLMQGRVLYYDNNVLVLISIKRGAEPLHLASKSYENIKACVHFL